MAEVVKVYLDHLIARDDFLYKRTSIKSPDSHSPQPFLRLRDLIGENPMNPVLRKPDFQRATWAWSPSECVSLLESFIKEQVIPSIIMWLSPRKEWYVLDGGHRISVVLAWLRDDWGDKVSEVSPHVFQGDADLEARVRNAANEVRSLLLKKDIGEFKDYRLAFERSEQLRDETDDFEENLGDVFSERAAFYRSFLSGSSGFPLQWVKGDHEKAEESFLKINTGGRSLTEWEIKLVNNRNSSFARVIMSIADITRAEHCWPTKAEGNLNKSLINQSIEEILAGATTLHKILFEPTPSSLSAELKQPLFNESLIEPDKKPAYLSELFTVIEGGKGRETQTERLLKRDEKAPPQMLITNGLKLIREGQDVLNHLVGMSAESLGLTPPIYFYSENGKYVRSMLFGFIYWLFIRNDTEITFKRKLLFSAYRDSFERVLITKKREIFNTFSRQGSGPEITAQTAKYYQDFLLLLMKFEGHVMSEAFVEEYEEVFRQKTVAPARTQFPHTLVQCSVCRGVVDVSQKGLHTQPDESLPTHPFCKTNHDLIKNFQNGQTVIELPLLTTANSLEKPTQLTFLDFGDSFTG